MENENKLTVFFDNDCPICSREVNFIKKKDRENSISFIEIAKATPEEMPSGLSKSDLMAKIHAINSASRVITGVDVFREIYQNLGYKKLVSFSLLPLIRHCLSVCYSIFAKYRMGVGAFLNKVL